MTPPHQNPSSESPSSESPSDGRRRPTRAEIVSTVAVLGLVAVAVFALWPRSSDARGTAERAPVAAVSEAELAPLRAAADLEPCPGPDRPAADRGGVEAAVAGPHGDVAPGVLAGGPVAAGPLAGGPLAGVTVPCLGEPGSVELGSALADRPVLLNVWASWCAPCRAELPVLQEYAQRSDAVAVLGVNVRDDPRAALALLDELDVRLPSVLGDDLRPVLGVPPALPSNYLVRADGSVARVEPPVPFRSADEVAAAVERLRR